MLYSSANSWLGKSLLGADPGSRRIKREPGVADGALVLTAPIRTYGMLDVDAVLLCERLLSISKKDEEDTMNQASST